MAISQKRLIRVYSGIQENFLVSSKLECIMDHVMEIVGEGNTRNDFSNYFPLVVCLIYLLCLYIECKRSEEKS